MKIKEENLICLAGVQKEIMERRVRFGAAAWMMGEGDMVTCAVQTQTTTPTPDLFAHESDLPQYHCNLEGPQPENGHSVAATPNYWAGLF